VIAHGVALAHDAVDGTSVLDEVEGGGDGEWLRRGVENGRGSDGQRHGRKGSIAPVIHVDVLERGP
jgi:hypothetical protein